MHDTPPLTRTVARPGVLLAMALASTTGCRKQATAPAEVGDIPTSGNWGGLRIRTAGERTRPRQVVILLHGWGASGDDLVPLADMLPAPGRLFVFPEAPLTSPGGGRAWWPLDIMRLQAALERGLERDLRHDDPPGMPEARARVLALLDEIMKRTGLPSETLVLGGFSQGAMLAVDTALVASPLGGLVALSGTLVAETRWRAAIEKRAPRFPVFISHGQWDPVLPFSLAEALEGTLATAGAKVTWVPFAGGHEIPMPVLTGLQQFLARLSRAA